MKIAFLHDDELNRDRGVAAKVEACVAAWRDCGHEVTLVGLRDYRSGAGRGGFLGLYRHWCAVARAAEVISACAPDVIYMRYIRYAPFATARIAGIAPVVLEANTDDREEAWLVGAVHGLYNAATRHRLISSISGLVAVTGEIGLRVLPEPGNRRMLVLANALPESDGVLMGGDRDRYREGRRFSAVFAAGGAHPWQGLDLLERIAVSLPEVMFHVVGDVSSVVAPNAAGSNVRFHEPMSHSALVSFASQCDVGLSTLALYRKGMTEACPLKSRLYASVGLPQIITYTDPDFLPPPEYVLYVPGARLLEAGSIVAMREFFLRAVALDRSEARRDAQRRMGLPAKEALRLSFLAEIIEMRRGR